MKETNVSPEREAEPDQYANEAQVLSEIISSLTKFNAETRERMLRTVASFFDAGQSILATPKKGPPERGLPARSSQADSSFSEDRTISPKEFLFEKAPETDIERIACLAYYLTHYRNTRHFKTLDLSKLNTEAAQIKFSNPTVAVDNAARAGLLVPSTKGNKQISAVGELYVQALPNRQAAKDSLTRARRRRKSKKGQVASSEES